RNRTTGFIAGLLVVVNGRALSLTRPSPVTLDQGPAHIASATPAAQDKTHPTSEKTARPATEKLVRLSSADAVTHQLN
ncbi:EscD/YscD/HrpQ family type III secretion system inner membrane ring protein, partial [Pseudomonas syringae pv. tagetis]